MEHDSHADQDGAWQIKTDFQKMLRSGEDVEKEGCMQPFKEVVHGSKRRLYNPIWSVSIAIIGRYNLPTFLWHETHVVR